MTHSVIFNPWFKKPEVGASGLHFGLSNGLRQFSGGLEGMDAVVDG